MTRSEEFKIIHFSDLHFCKEFSLEKQLNKFEYLLSVAKNQNVQHAVITGDILEYANFDDLKLFFNLLKKYNFKDNNSLSITPGNHDIYSLSFKKNPIEVALNKNKIYKNYTNDFIEACKPYYEITKFPIFKKISHECLLIIINSNAKSDLTADQTPRGEIEQDLLIFIENELKKVDYINYKFKILALHHYPFIHSKNPFCSPHIQNLKLVQDWIVRVRFNLILSGHSHGLKINYLNNIPVVCSASGGQAEKMNAHIVTISDSIQIKPLKN